MTNIPSIVARLMQISRINEVTFQLVLFRYFHECVIRRLGQSQFKNNFILKGGNLIYAWQGMIARPTVDIDFLGLAHSNDIFEITDSFTKILSIESSDGVIFNVSDIKTEVINEQNQYLGVRISVPAMLGNIKQIVKVDVGFGDVITPGAILLEYPHLLELEPLSVMAYSVETVIAEKFHAMVMMPKINSRMKDFYDVILLLDHPTLRQDMLSIAIHETFKNRNTQYQADMPLFTEDYQNDVARNKMYQAYLNKIGIKNKQQFSQITEKIFDVLQPIYERLERK